MKILTGGGMNAIVYINVLLSRRRYSINSFNNEAFCRCFDNLIRRRNYMDPWHRHIITGSAVYIYRLRTCNSLCFFAGLWEGQKCSLFIDLVPANPGCLSFVWLI